MDDGSLVTSLEILEQFGRRYAAGLGQRVDDAVAVEGPEVLPASRAALAGAGAEGALVGRATWTDEAGPRAACLVWTGSLAFLIGTDDRTAGELTDAEAELLDQHLRFNVAEGGTDEPPVEWTTLRRVAAADLEDELRRDGVAEETEVATTRVTVGERAVELRFAAATAAIETGDAASLDAEAAVDDAAGPEATVADLEAAGEAQELDVAGAAQELGLHGTSPTGDPRPAPAPPAGEGTDPDDIPDLGNLHNLLDVRMPLTIRLGTTRMNLERLLRLAPGAIVELDQNEDEPLEVLANGHVIARGEVVVMDERFGLRITEIGGAEERLRAL